MARNPGRINGRVIGIDLDNTLLTYDGLLHRLALEQRLIPAPLPRNKTAVRDAVRQLPDGEILWQRLQALAYGPMIHQAEPSPGVFSFLKRCRDKGDVVHVISHKTEYAAQDRNRCHLHDAAMGWLEDNGFFDPDGGGLIRANIHFLPSRAEKIQRIKALHCCYFIDDLRETFMEAGFPRETVGILYNSQFGPLSGPGLKTAGSFQEVETIVFG